MEAAAAAAAEEEEEYELASSAVDRMPPGFRFHPNDWEIIIHYLLNKVVDPRFRAVAIGEIDLNKCEPWDLPQKAPRMGEKEWFFFFEKETKYPSGTRTNRATASGYWKATGKDKEIRRGKVGIVGMKKTLVFYKGRAPKGEKTNWVIHEYRLHGHFPSFNLSSHAKEKWVVCRVFHKKDPAQAIEHSRIGPFEDDYDLVELPPLTDYSSLTANGNPNLSSAADQAADEMMIKQDLVPDSFELQQHRQNDDVSLHHSKMTSSCDQYYSMVRSPDPGSDCSTRVLHADGSALPPYEYQDQDGVSSSMMEWYLTNFPIKGGDDAYGDLNSRVLEPDIYIGGKEPERICKMEPVSFDVSTICSPSQETGISSGMNWEKESGSKKLCDEELSFSPNISDMDSLWSY